MKINAGLSLTLTLAPFGFSIYQKWNIFWIIALKECHLSLSLERSLFFVLFKQIRSHTAQMIFQLPNEISERRKLISECHQGNISISKKKKKKTSYFLYPETSIKKTRWRKGQNKYHFVNSADGEEGIYRLHWSLEYLLHGLPHGLFASQQLKKKATEKLVISNESEMSNAPQRKLQKERNLYHLRS